MFWNAAIVVGGQMVKLGMGREVIGCISTVVDSGEELQSSRDSWMLQAAKMKLMATVRIQKAWRNSSRISV